MKKLCLLLAFFCIAQYTKAPREGIQGQVYWVSGNQMPGPGKNIGAELGVARELHIYKAARLADVEKQDQFYQAVRTELITKTWSKTDGTFKIKLPPGEYSIFTQEPKGLFGNIVDGDGCVSCVTVKSKKYSWVAFTVDYEAAY